MRMNIVVGIASACLLMATIVAANWAILRFGVVPVGFGLMAPAGVYFVGAAFILRDVIHDTLGTKAVLVAIILGSLLSVVVSPAFAIASGTAFLFSELADLFVYSPLRQKHHLGAMISSNLVGSFVDSALFLLLAFGSMQYILGQVVGKLWITAFFVVVTMLVRHVVSEWMRKPPSGRRRRLYAYSDDGE